MPAALHLQDCWNALAGSANEEPQSAAWELPSSVGSVAVGGMARRRPANAAKTSFINLGISNIVRLLQASDADGTLMKDGVVRKSDPLYKMGPKHPGSSAGWASLAYQASERADEALKVAQGYQEDAQSHSLIARACAEQARAAQLQQDMTARTLSHAPQTPKFKKFCANLRTQLEDAGGPGKDSADLAHLQSDCSIGELTSFCTDLKMHLKAHPERMHDPEMVQLRKFCGGLEAQLDQATGDDAPSAASELAKRGYEDGFTIYDTPPEVPFKYFPRTMSKGKTLLSGNMTIAEAKEKCLQTKGCKAFTTSARFFGLVGKTATTNEKGFVQLKDAWEDPDLKSGTGGSYKYVGFLTQPPWLDTQKFEAPMRRLWVEGPSTPHPAAQALLLLTRPVSPVTSPEARTQRQRDFL